jgi:hypothetical protein
MRLPIALAACGVMLTGSLLPAAEIRGQYIESRTCDIYTGPCFANAEMTLAGKEAVLAWKVEEGSWAGSELAGLSVALVVKANGTLGTDGVFAPAASQASSVILVDENSTPEQEQALVAFVKASAKDLTGDIQKVERTPIKLDYTNMHGSLKAGRQATIETRALGKHDCVCTNEAVFYQPLVEVQQALPAYSVKQSYRGKALGGQWEHNNTRSAFLATFRK